jgi:hypothetical protein
MRNESQNGSTRALRLIGQGREAEVFEWQDGRVLKLLRGPGPIARLVFEVAALEAAPFRGRSRTAGLRGGCGSTGARAS